MLISFLEQFAKINSMNRYFYETFGVFIIKKRVIGTLGFVHLKLPFNGLKYTSTIISHVNELKSVLLQAPGKFLMKFKPRFLLRMLTLLSAFSISAFAFGNEWP